MLGERELSASAGGVHLPPHVTNCRNTGTEGVKKRYTVRTNVQN
jgi:hypothetical protein